MKPARCILSRGAFFGTTPAAKDPRLTCSSFDDFMAEYARVCGAAIYQYFVELLLNNHKKDVNQNALQTAQIFWLGKTQLKIYVFIYYFDHVQGNI